MMMIRATTTTAAAVRGRSTLLMGQQSGRIPSSVGIGIGKNGTVGRINNATSSNKRTSASTAYAYNTSYQQTTYHQNPFQRAFYWYSEKLESHPIITKGLTAGVIGALGDILCQVFIDKPEKELKRAKESMKNGGELTSTTSSSSSPLWWFEPDRSIRFFVLGVGLVGPWCHAWFGFLATKFPQLTVKSIVTRVALDQFAFTPVILSTFISSLWTLESIMGDDKAKDGEEKEEPLMVTIPKRLQETIPNLIVANWMLWGPVQLFNFRVVPQKYQVLFANMISLVWNAYLSFSTRSTPEGITEEQEERIVKHAPLPVTLVHRMTTRLHEHQVEAALE